MSFKSKPKKVKSGQDCKDFKPMFFNRDYCKLTSRCGNTYQHIVYGRFGGFCTGVKNMVFEKEEK